MKCQHGFSTIAILILLMLLSAWLTYLVKITNTEFSTTVAYTTGMQAQYLAEAGANTAIVKLMHNKEYAKENNSDMIEYINLSTGSCEIRIQNDGEKATIFAIGIAGKAKRQITVEMQVDSQKSQMTVTKWKVA